MSSVIVNADKQITHVSVDLLAAAEERIKELESRVGLDSSHMFEVNSQYVKLEAENQRLREALEMLHGETQTSHNAGAFPNICWVCAALKKTSP